MLYLGLGLSTGKMSEVQTLFCAFLAVFVDVWRPFLVVYSNKSDKSKQSLILPFTLVT